MWPLRFSTLVLICSWVANKKNPVKQRILRAHRQATFLIRNTISLKSRGRTIGKSFDERFIVRKKGHGKNTNGESMKLYIGWSWFGSPSFTQQILLIIFVH
jgi:DNA-binding protein